ncbi:MAG: TraB/GumN family protein [Xanthomonadales bacterium]
MNQIAMRVRRVARTAFVVCLAALSQPLAAEPDSAIFWALSRDGQAAGYLLGTIHSEDPRVLDFPDRFIERLSGSDIFAMELVPDLPTLSRLTDYMHYADGTTLESRIGADRFERLRAALAGYRLPSDWIARMKVWAAMMTLSVPPPESGFFMDFSLSLRAAGAGLEVVGLETLEQQLSFLEDMPQEQQIELLDHALDEFERVDEVHRRMVDSYLAGDLRELSRETEQQMAVLDPDTRAYFIRRGIDERNRRMVDAVLPHLARGRVFIAVGALHLPGENGLVALLRSEGYELAPLPLPFLASE